MEEQQAIASGAYSMDSKESLELCIEILQKLDYKLWNIADESKLIIQFWSKGNNMETERPDDPYKIYAQTSFRDLYNFFSKEKTRENIAQICGVAITFAHKLVEVRGNVIETLACIQKLCFKLDILQGKTLAFVDDKIDENEKDLITVDWLDEGSALTRFGRKVVCGKLKWLRSAFFTLKNGGRSGRSKYDELLEAEEGEEYVLELLLEENKGRRKHLLKVSVERVFSRNIVAAGLGDRKMDNPFDDIHHESCLLIKKAESLGKEPKQQAFLNYFEGQTCCAKTTASVSPSVDGISSSSIPSLDEIHTALDEKMTGLRNHAKEVLASIGTLQQQQQQQQAGSIEGDVSAAALLGKVPDDLEGALASGALTPERAKMLKKSVAAVLRSYKECAFEMEFLMALINAECRYFRHLLRKFAREDLQGIPKDLKKALRI